MDIKLTDDEENLKKNREIVTNKNDNKIESKEENIKDEQEERAHFLHILNTFKSYKKNSYQRLNNTIKYLESLPLSHREKLSKYRTHLDQVAVAIDHNYELIKLIIGDVIHMFENIYYGESNLYDGIKITKPRPMDIEKMHSILKQMVREWTSEGEVERNTCYQPILDQIDQHFKALDNYKDIKILVPGAGLGRLAYEIASRGYTCQGNEYSLFMLFTSNFILNKSKGINSLSFYPYIHQYHNNLLSSDQLTRLTFPDVNPCDLPEDSNFSMVAGNFIEIYTEPNSWDCVSTCFFIDTANNVASYIETIWKILKPGGIWINLGPLLYHYADLPNEQSIEPSYEIVKEVILAFGFKMIKEQTDLRSYYTQNPKSMLAYEYRSVFLVCLKPIHTQNQQTN